MQWNTIFGQETDCFGLHNIFIVTRKGGLVTISPKSKNPIQTDEEMSLSIAEGKQTRVYGGRTETAAVNDARISEIVTSLADGVENLIGDRQKVSLSDLDTIQAVTVRYIRKCSQSAALPTVSGLAKALGVSRQAIYDHIRQHPKSETAKWFEDISDSFGEAMMQAALTGTVAPVPAIFIAKARFNWRDAITIETPVDNRFEEELSPEEIAAKYADWLPEE